MNTRVAIVVGAGTGLGQASAQGLHKAGYTVVGVDRSQTGLRELPTDIRSEVADATDPDVARPLLDRIVAEVGAPGVLVNTVGTYELGDALSVTPQLLRQMTDVNLGAALWLTQAVVPHMQEEGGVIVHVAARPGIEPTAGMAAYAVTKAALVHLVRTLAIELSSSGIRVNAVAPQIIATAKNKAIFPAEMLAAAVEPGSIADVITFLASDAAASVTGAVVPTYGK
ncbi:MAG TPA: SDR family NAD(P)-dependent oxidoreductase [Acidimicrobiales bacterium]|jgi:NAD(P)-dependent dehydrogenase (short-subunit alcohol dehydrogenase family)|nr:SDR family NAD(P)-dependent oxidoreductase [Acidimicrobiales bacterium]